jgi:hypothetical protein
MNGEAKKSDRLYSFIYSEPGNSVIVAHYRKAGVHDLAGWYHVPQAVEKRIS